MGSAPHPVTSGLAAGERVASLDGVRGVAVLLVLVHHFLLYGGPELLQPATHPILYNVALSGWIGVDLFFVLSGFLITGILYDAKGGPGYFRNFYARRVLRIFPLYYGVLLALLVLLPLVIPDSERLRLLRQDAGWYWTYLVNLKIAAHDGWGRAPGLGHFWSLAVEEQFYLFWPVAVLLLSRRTLLYACLGCLVASCLMRAGLHRSGHVLAAYVLTPARADTLALGAFIALIVRGPNGLAQVRRWSPLVLTASLASVAAIFLWRGPDYHDPVVQTIGFSFLACLFAALVGLAVSSPAQGLPQRVLGAPLLVVFGRYSYALYVFHHPLLLFKPKAVSSALLPTVLGSDVPARVAFAILGIALTLGLAMVSWHAYEKQFLKLKRLFPYGGSSGRTTRHPPEVKDVRREVVTSNAISP
jgi:peptidoglycan/LPS O-acetylase OafA/YrhL